MEAAGSAENRESRAPERARRSPQPLQVPERPAQRGAADSGSAGFWRPWEARGRREDRAPRHAAEVMPGGHGMIAAPGKPSQFRHPLRLLWPKSKCYDYLYQEAETLLKNFPIQATISFYEDSDSEDEIEELTCEN
ncbi:protein ripply2 [Cavia porcellus]|uniref:protein ripply2 n=1 Tax=Cavia porcellus TaxID=10141 RepID=UPI002FDFC8B6